MIIMTENSVWRKAQTVELKIAENILPEFNIGFCLVDTLGLEPKTSRVWSERSNRLSYASEQNIIIVILNGDKVKIFFGNKQFSETDFIGFVTSFVNVRKMQISLRFYYQ